MYTILIQYAVSSKEPEIIGSFTSHKDAKRTIQVLIENVQKKSYLPFLYKRISKTAYEAVAYHTEFPWRISIKEIGKVQAEKGKEKKRKGLLPRFLSYLGLSKKNN